MQSSVGNLGSAYYRMGQIQKAISFYEQALRLARESNDRQGEGAWLGNLANCFSDLGQNARAIEYYEQALAISREVGDRKGEVSRPGQPRVIYIQKSVRTPGPSSTSEQALLIDREIESREGEADDLENLGDSYRNMGRHDEALRCFTEALAIARDIGYRLAEASSHAHMGDLHVSQENWGEAARELEQAIEIADDIGSAQYSKAARESLALVNVYQNNLAAAREMVEAARKYDVPLSNHRTSAMLGVVALRQGDLNTAREAFAAAINQASQLIALSADQLRGARL